MKIAKLIADGTISIEDLAHVFKFIERAQLIESALKACKTTINFPIGVNEISCYSYNDASGEYQSWGIVRSDGTFICSCNWGGDHIIGEVNLLDSKDVFQAFEIKEFESDLTRFLKEQIEKAKR